MLLVIEQEETEAAEIFSSVASVASCSHGESGLPVFECAYLRVPGDLEAAVWRNSASVVGVHAAACFEDTLQRELQQRNYRTPSLLAHCVNNPLHFGCQLGMLVCHVVLFADIRLKVVQL